MGVSLVMPSFSALLNALVKVMGDRPALVFHKPDSLEDQSSPFLTHSSMVCIAALGWGKL